jgi:hypothetical protein
MGRIAGMHDLSGLFSKGACSELTTNVVKEENRNGGPLPVGADARPLILRQR